MNAGTYHFHTDCPYGKRIKPEARIEGTGKGTYRCAHCNALCARDGVSPDPMEEDPS